MTSSPDNVCLLLHALVDQELDAAASFSLEKRLADEPRLAAAFARTVELKQAIERLEEPTVSADFYDWVSMLASLAVVPFSARPKPSRQFLGGAWRTIVVTALLASGSTYLLTTWRAR